jgi:hypothetical protein
LKNETGVGDLLYEKGLLWERIKENAMLNESNDDFVVMDLTPEEYEFIENYCLPESKGKVTLNVKRKSMCGFTWRNLTKNLKEGVFTIEHKQIDSFPYYTTSLDTPSFAQTMKVPLEVKQLKYKLRDDVERTLLRRYREAEK